MSTVVFGGTFEYPHLGHANCVRELLRTFDLVLVAPTAQNPFKERKTFELFHRVEMLRLVLEYEDIPLAADRFGRGALIMDFPYCRSREFIEHWWEICGEEMPLAWGIGPDLKEEVKTWSGGWLAAHPKISFFDLPDQGPTRSKEVREGRMAPHPAIMPYLQQYPELMPKPPAESI